MALRQALTTTPTILAGLTNEEVYTVQFRSAYKSYIQSETSAPTNTDKAFIVGTNGVVSAKKTASENIYVWSDTAGGFAVYDEST